MLLRVLFIMLGLLPGGLYGLTDPVIERGFLDLRQMDLSRREPIDLAGDWEFHWDRLLSSQDIKTLGLDRTYRYVPLPWSESRPGYPVYPPFGKATYRLRILLPGEHPR